MPRNRRGAEFPQYRLSLMTQRAAHMAAALLLIGQDGVRGISS